MLVMFFATKYAREENRAEEKSWEKREEETNSPASSPFFPSIKQICASFTKNLKIFWWYSKSFPNFAELYNQKGNNENNLDKFEEDYAQIYRPIPIDVFLERKEIIKELSKEHCNELWKDRIWIYDKRTTKRR